MVNMQDQLKTRKKTQNLVKGLLYLEQQYNYQKQQAMQNVNQKNKNVGSAEDASSPQKRLPRKVRYSEPYLINEQSSFNMKDPSKLQKQDDNMKIKRQPRYSDVGNHPIQTNLPIYSSPQHQDIKSIRYIFHSPTMKKQLGDKNAMINLSDEKIHLSPSIKRRSPIQSHKQTLNKIEKMLQDYGVTISSQKQEPKGQKQKFYKNDRIPVFQTNQTKKTEPIMLKKKVQVQVGRPNSDHNSEDESPLKDTVSTHSSCKMQLKITEFIFGKQLGKGKFGVVRIARHKKTGLIFSVKIIKKSVIRKQSILDQFIRQVKIQSFLKSPLIVRLYDVFDDAENVYLVMELACSGNLYQNMKIKGVIQENQAQGLIRSICEGVSELHQNNIIHRDFKLENIVLSFGLIKICDFGWSAHSKDLMRETFCGTPLYASPELLSGNTYDEKVDLWAIGILSYEMMTGKIPFDIKNEKQLSKIISSPIDYPTTLTPEAASFLQNLLTKDPKYRKNIKQILNHPFLMKK